MGRSLGVEGNTCPGPGAVEVIETSFHWSLPMQVFVTGATGYVGWSVATAFRRAGHRVWGLTRSEAKARRLAQQEIEPVVGDLGDPKTYADVAAECAALVHAAFEYSANGIAKDKKAIETLIEAGRRGARPKTLIFTSGARWPPRPRGRPAIEATSAPCRSARPRRQWGTSPQ